nr:PREDICTED: uncharacterized protein LOC105676913 [Linepithema humile]
MCVKIRTVRRPHNRPLGWILSGPTGNQESPSEEASVLNCVLTQDVNSLLQRFWEDEEISLSPPLTEEEERCERHFDDTHSRSQDGRYVVRLPFKHAPPIDIGDSLSIVLSCYNRLEKRLESRAEICSQYSDFLEEYRSLGHMKPVASMDRTDFIPVYIPHHPVLREASCTTKLRVVFNASCKTRNGSSLNDHLLIGPKLQQDLPAVLLRWRQWCYVYTADIAKMFFMYGLAPAPYLAMRVLKQLALDEGNAYPSAVSILQDFIYVDDALFGADDVRSLTDTRFQLVELMKKEGFQLRKWASNSSDLLRDLSADQPEVTDHLILKDESLKVLGLSWLPLKDVFRFIVNFVAPDTPTKRSILSFVARLYDPLGWAAPVVIVAKILLQELWFLRCDWDAPLPDTLLQRWSDYVAELESLNEIRIPRWTGQHPSDLAYEIHGFADASSRAYAAVVYLRVLHSMSSFQISLLVAKTKVASVKTASIPRLELNAIVLLSRLIKWTLSSLRIPSTPVYGWTDSSITLA